MPVLLLLLASNVFMTIAWYWHLKGGMEKPILSVILISWGIALVEYCFAVPANRLGYAGGWSGGQLKIAQEAITLTVFGIFMVLVLGEPLHWRHLAAFGCIMHGRGRLSLPRQMKGARLGRHSLLRSRNLPAGFRR
jgi:uncharacterized protein (DUF486 family)